MGVAVAVAPNAAQLFLLRRYEENKMDMKKKQKKSDSPAINPSFFKTRIDCAKVGLHTPASECPEPGCLGKQCWWLCQSRAQPTWPCLNDRGVFFLIVGHKKRRKQ